MQEVPHDDEGTYEYNPLDMIMRRRVMMSSFSSGSAFSDQPGQRFNSGEHEAVGDGGWLQFNKGRMEPMATYKIEFTQEGQNHLQLTYGQLVALSSDFYADYRRPLCNQQSEERQDQQATDNFNSLVCGTPSFLEVQQILLIMEEEAELVATTVRLGMEPSVGYYASGIKLDVRYNVATGGGEDLITQPGRYLKLAGTNFDHFGGNAARAYAIAHRVALNAAIDAEIGDDDALAQAYAMNAFADHFLTDLFAAGHMRTPRQELYGVGAGSQKDAQKETLDEWSILNAKQNASGVCAKGMHDEDNLNGLWVTTVNQSDTWLAYGDCRYYDLQNYANAFMVRNAVALSSNEVWTTYLSKQMPKKDEYGDPIYAALLTAPTLVPWTGGKQRESKVQYSPLYVPDDGGKKVLCRTDITELLRYDWNDVWLIGTTAAQLNASGPKRGPSMFPPCGQRKGTPEKSGVQVIGGSTLLDRDGHTPLSISTGALGAYGLLIQSPMLAGAYTPGNDTVEIALTSLHSRKLYRAKWTHQHGWSSWLSPFKSPVNSSPAVSVRNGRFDWFYIGKMKVEHVTFDNNNVRTTESLGNPPNLEASSAISTATDSDGNTYAVVLDEKQSAWVRRRPHNSDDWDAWTQVHGNSNGYELKLSTPPLVYNDPDSTGTHLFGNDGDGHVWWSKVDDHGNWDNWQLMGGEGIEQATSRVAVVGSGNTLECCNRDNEGGLSYRLYNTNHDQWGNYTHFNFGEVVSYPTACNFGPEGTTHVFYVGSHHPYANMIMHITIVNAVVTDHIWVKTDLPVISPVTLIPAGDSLLAVVLLMSGDFASVTFNKEGKQSTAWSTFGSPWHEIV
eukprot:TRINITY_DN5777_c0_g1_i1.p1 TRINITY_DN5777_c0_g1~~TRINITY_DN5777_c0_g1_i1.p1  ORF type:complete len:871 (+),score=227.45 TRINITY_DN5777_c0_g1_i1:86-2614(+)